MQIAVEKTAEKRLAHVCEIPGAVAAASQNDQVALTLYFEAMRFQSCFPYLPPVKRDCVSVAESYERERLGGPGTAMPVFRCDRAWTAEQYQCAVRMLRESVQLYQTCYASFPDPSHDIAEDGHPECSASLMKMQYHTALHGLTGLVLPEMARAADCEDEIEAVIRSEWFRNRCSEAAGHETGLAAAWLRAALELTHNEGRTLYRFGISTVGARTIVNPFCFTENTLLFY